MQLMLRKTHRYVGTCQNEDEWEYLCDATIMASRTVGSDDPEDMCESQLTTYFIKVVTTEYTEEQIKQALKDSFTQVGCHHDWDCCGCRSYRVTKAELLSQGIWVVQVASSRNY